MKFDKRALLLYAVTDRSWLKDQTLYEQVEQALQGGVSLVQLREKTLDEAHFLQEAAAIQSLCRQYGVPFIINDRVDVAQKIKADGIHVGQHDRNAGEVRSILGQETILGVSVQTVEQAILAEKQGADYLGVGAIYPTDSKKDAEHVTKETLTAICRAVKIPVVAIGGVDQTNVLTLKGSGICGIAVIHAIFAQKDIRLAASELKKLAEQVVCYD